MKNATLICDLQYGSTGKGLIAGYLAEQEGPDTVVTAWSANAGHTYVDSRGKTYIHTMLANGVVSPNLKHVMIGPGSLIDVDALIRECIQCKDLLRDAKVMVHQNACVIQPRHRMLEEQTMVGIGSTRKGVGAALCEKIERQVYDGNGNNPIIADHFRDEIEDKASMRGLRIRVVGGDEYNATIDDADRIQVEGAQGFSLGINSGFYPYTTSRECTPAQIMTDCAIPMSKLDRTVGTLRTYPIRVSNRYDADGNMVGYSGPCYTDQYELNWEDLGVEAEKTTVTRLPRRVFTFSYQQLRDALRVCEPNELFLNFVNYLDSDLQSIMVKTINENAHEFGAGIRYLGYGPEYSDVVKVGG